MDPVKGLTIKKNRAGITVIRLHYSADPDKDPDTEKGKEWFDRAIQMYPGGVNSLGWRREMEIDPNAGVGELVFPEFAEKEREILCDPFLVDGKYRLYGGMDWGARNPVAFYVVAYGPDEVFYVIWEYQESLYLENKSIYDVAKNIKQRCPYYDRLEWIAADPTMWTENQARKDGFTSNARMFFEDLPPELKIDKLMPAHHRSDMLFVQKLKGYWSEPPYRVLVSKQCPQLIQEYRNLRYPPRIETVNEAEKILDKNNHGWDATKYLILSHPASGTAKTERKLGTYGYLNECSMAAERIARETGRSRDEVFREIYQAAPRG